MLKLLIPVPALVLIGALLLAACGSDTGALRRAERQNPGGDAEHGKRLIQVLGCGACHVVPGVYGANATVGPPLTAWAYRDFIAGTLPNTTENLILWIQYPQVVEPGTAMPNLGVTEADARDIATYLYTLD